MATFQRISRDILPAADSIRRGKTDVVYLYRDEQSRVYSLIIPAEEDSAARVQEELHRQYESAQRGGAETIEL